MFFELTSWCYIRSGALYTVSKNGFWKGGHGSPSVFTSNFISIMHRCRDNDIFSLTRTDVMGLYQLGGAIRSSKWRILKGRSWYPVCVPCLVFLYHTPFPRQWGLFANWKWRHHFISARGRCIQFWRHGAIFARGRYTQFLMTHSERVTMVSRSCSMVLYPLGDAVHMTRCTHGLLYIYIYIYIYM